METGYIMLIVSRFIGWSLFNVGICRGIFLLKFHPKKASLKNHYHAVLFFSLSLFNLIYILKLELACLK